MIARNAVPHSLTLAEEADSAPDLAEAPDCLLGAVTSRIGGVRHGTALPMAEAARIQRPPHALPVLFAPAQRGEAAARKREAFVLAHGVIEECEQLVDLGDPRALAREEARRLLAERRAERPVGEL